MSVQISRIPHIATIAKANSLQTRLHLISALAAHVAVMYGTATHDAAISTLYIVLFARVSGMTSQVERAILESKFWLMQKARMRTERLKSNQHSSRKRKEMRSRSRSHLARSLPRTSKISDGLQTDPCPGSISLMNLKSRTAPLFLSFSMLTKVSKAAPIVSHPNLVLRKHCC